MPVVSEEDDRWLACLDRALTIYSSQGEVDLDKAIGAAAKIYAALPSNKRTSLGQPGINR